MFTVTKQQWAVFEEWENEYNARSLPELSPERSLELADAMFEQAWRMSPEYVNPLHGIGVDELAVSEELSAIMARRAVFERHAARHGLTR